MDGQETTVTTGTETKTDTTQTTPVETKSTETITETAKTYTEADIEAFKKEWAKEAKKQADEAAKKAEELAKLSEEEKQKKLLEEANARILEFENKQKQQELLDITRRELKNNEVPEGFLKFIHGADEKEITQNAKEFKGLLSKLVQEGVDKRFKDNGYTPQGGNGEFKTQNKNLRDAVLAALNK